MPRRFSSQADSWDEIKIQSLSQQQSCSNMTLISLLSGVVHKQNKHCSETKDLRIWSDIPRSQPQILPSSQHLHDQKRQSKSERLARSQRPSSLRRCCDLWAVCMQPLIYPVITTALRGLDINRVGLMKTKTLHPLKQHCQSVPPVPSRSRTGCESQAELTPLSQIRLFACLLLGSFPWLANPSPAEPVQSLACICQGELQCITLCSLVIISRILATRGAASSRPNSAGSPLPNKSLLFSSPASHLPLATILALPTAFSDATLRAGGGGKAKNRHRARKGTNRPGTQGERGRGRPHRASRCPPTRFTMAS